MSYCQLYYHLVWTTKNRQPLLLPAVAEVVYGFIRSKTIGLGGTFFALNGIEDHVHLVVTIPPTLAVSTFVGQVKGVSSARFNKEQPGRKLYWQAEYGAFSFDKKRLPHVIRYVERQQVHHATKNVIPILERSMEEAQRPLIRESLPLYTTDDAAWWQEML
jgi:REP element-mobilizing transposase RayT